MGESFQKDIIERYNLWFDNEIRFKEDELFVFKYLKHVNRVKSVSLTGYCYTVPDWNVKYNSYDITGFEKLIKESYRLELPTKIRNSYMFDYAAIFISHFKTGPFEQKRQLCRKLTALPSECGNKFFSYFTWLLFKNLNRVAYLYFRRYIKRIF